MSHARPSVAPKLRTARPLRRGGPEREPAPRPRLLVAAGGLVLAGCMGPLGVTEAPSDPGAAPALAESASPGSTPSSPPRPASPSAPAAPPAPSACVGAKPLPAAMFLRRLTNWEYNNTLRDLIGYEGKASQDFDLVPDNRKPGQFDTNAETIAMSTPAFERFQDAAERIGRQVAASPAKLKALTGCEPVTDACVAPFVESFGRRAFRRPLTADEKKDLLALAATGATPAEKVSQALQGILLSMSFLFRPEVGEAGDADPSRPGLVKLTGYEIATRLSYSLLATTPPDALLDGAARGELSTAEGVEKAARAMLTDPRAKEAVAKFYGQWFHLYTLKGASFDAKKYPGWSAKLGEAMTEESWRFLESVLWNPGASVLDLLDAKHSFVNADLAKHYGIPAPAKDWDRVTFAPGDERGGLLTLGSVLALTSKPDHVSAILRGRFVRQAITCTTIPDPPPNIPPLSNPAPNETERQRFERHTKDPACGACHRLMDPVGFGLDRYDAIGARRTVDDHGKPVTGKGVLVAEGAGPDLEFEGAVDLGRKLRARGDFARCAAIHAFRFALGKNALAANDLCAIEQVTRAFAEAQHGFPELLVALVKSDSFRYREPSGAQKGAAR